VIGWSAIVLQLVVAAVAVVFAVGTSAQLRKRRSVGNLLLVIIFVPACVFLLRRDVVHVSYMRDLRKLRPAEVTLVSVCGKKLESEAEKRAIVTSLNGSKWFEPSHGGWKKPATLSISLRSGGSLDYSIARYRSGAVVVGQGYAFSDSLPAVLSGFGCSLPLDLNR
jgi:hypothetical protein